MAVLVALDAKKLLVQSLAVFLGVLDELAEEHGVAQHARSLFGQSAELLFLELEFEHCV